MDVRKAKTLKKSIFEDRDSKQIEEGSNQNGDFLEEKRLRAPVFLNRNRRKMKQLRKHLWA
jgi:hypothetical protein